MKKHRKYEPARGPQQRRRLLRELGRIPPRKRFSVSPREVRRVTAKMFNFEPLTRLSQKQLALLKKLTRLTVEQSIAYQTERALELSTGKAEVSERGLYPSIPRKSSKPSRERVRRIFSDGREYDKTLLVSKRGASRDQKPLSTYRSRGLKDYREEGALNILRDVEEIYARKRSAVRVLSVGALTGKMLAELEKEAERRGLMVETHALSPDDVPKHPVDAYHMLTAEYMPKEFSGRFDLIESFRALEYSLFPHIALRNIVKALAPGGRAYVQYYGGRFRADGQTPVESFLSIYQNTRASQAGKQIVKEGLAFKKAMGGTHDGVEKVIGKADDSKRRALAWCNEVARLRSLKGLDVGILGFDWKSPYCPWAPSMILIERKR